MLPQIFYSTNEIVRDSRGSTHFFDTDAKRFFSSRIGQNAYRTANPFKTLFTTSEQFVMYNGYSERRKYSVRLYDSRTKNIDTVGEFQQYRSSREANTAAIRLIPTIEYSVEDQHEYALLLNEAYDVQKRRAMYKGESKFYAPDLGYVSLLTNRHFFGAMETD